MLKKYISYLCIMFPIAIYGCNKPKAQNENNTFHIDSIASHADTLVEQVKSDYTIVQTDSIVAVRNNLTLEIDTLLINENEGNDGSNDEDISSTDSTHEDDLSSFYFFNTRHDVILLVGPYLSYEYSYNGSGGAHPIYGAYYRTIYIPSKKEVSLDSLFNPDVIFKALLKDSLIVHSMTNKTPEDLYELTSSLEGGCEIDFSELLISFAIKSIDSKKVEVEFGLTHGCEVMRGNFTTITINLPVSSVLKEYCNN